MVTCKNCKSTNVKVYDLNFAHRKREGEPSAKVGLSQYQFHCRTCQNMWEFDPEAKKVYFEYANLKPRTTLVAHVMKPDGTYTPQYIKPEELMRRKELARMLSSTYKSHLNLDPGEWFEIERDAS